MQNMPKIDQINRLGQNLTYSVAVCLGDVLLLNIRSNCHYFKPVSFDFEASLSLSE